MMKKHKIPAFLLALSCLLTLSACSETETETVSTDSIEEKTPAVQPAVQQENNSFTITRSKRDTSAPMGEEGTWTIFVYLCGADLESKLGGFASGDLQEMVDSSANDNVRYVVQTGGANRWDADVDADKTQRFLICNGEMQLVDTQEMQDMGKSETLTEFLKWGIQNYSASEMGLVLWNHGSGSISGVCFDEQYEDDSLFLREIDASLQSVFPEMTEKFEFIGFDACLMSTLETASMLATHANYMIASEEVEAGYGWDYQAIGDYLAENPTANGLEVGKVICDSFYAGCKQIGCESSATLSVTDLSEIDPLLVAFNSYSEDVYQAIDSNQEQYTNFARNISKTENFGGNNSIEGYTNMIDFGGLVQAGSQLSTHVQDVETALQKAVVYQKKGSDHANASGLSIYYPLKLSGSEELSIFKDVAPNSYYLGLVDKVAYGTVNSGMDSYENNSILDIITNIWNGSDYTTTDDDSFDYEFILDTIWDYVNDYEPTGESPLIRFDTEPYLDEDGNFGFVLSQDALDNTDYVESMIFMMSDDETAMLSLGTSGEIYADWESGTFVDNFDGFWFCLPDEQLLNVCLESNCDGYDIYTAPVLLNGEETCLRFAYDYNEIEIEILGVWNGIDENGCSGRETVQLQEGDVITPIYRVYSLEDESEDTVFYGDDYIYEPDETLYFTMLPDSVYDYCFCINDIYGDYFLTDSVNFIVDGEDIYFDAE